MSGGHSDTAPPDPIPNSVVKRISGDGSVGLPHVRVAHRQAPIPNKPTRLSGLFSYCSMRLYLRAQPPHARPEDGRSWLTSKTLCSNETPFTPM